MCACLYSHIPYPIPPPLPLIMISLHALLNYQFLSGRFFRPLTLTATPSLSTGRTIGRLAHSLDSPASLRQTTVTRASFVLASHYYFPSPGASTECATPIPNLSPDSMLSHNNLLGKSDPQLYKRSRAAYVSCQQALLSPIVLREVVLGATRE